jgi:hypothetical protein
MKAHAGQCSWHCDQYEQECDCGAARPATVHWAEREVSAARSALGWANDRLAIAEARLREIAADAPNPPQGPPLMDARKKLIERLRASRSRFQGCAILAMDHK